MSDSAKSDHDLLIEIKTLLGVVQDTLRQLEKLNEAQHAFNRNLENRVTKIETDRAGKMPEYDRFVHKTNNALQLSEARFNKLDGQLDGAAKALSFSKWAMGIAVAAAVALGVVQLKPAPHDTQTQTSTSTQTQSR